MKPRVFSVAEKERIVLEVAHIGAAAASRKYNIARNVINRWCSQYKEHGIIGLKRKAINQSVVDTEKQQLLEENMHLKIMLAESELELRIKSELLKKTLLRQKKKDL
jgi:transposase-like protein